MIEQAGAKDKAKAKLARTIRDIEHEGARSQTRARVAIDLFVAKDGKRQS